ncbi:cytochrome c oxidase subunit II [Herbaspirillum sp. HC18]|nr:cytochrome c oxidase subunit II [Herbaspirillum sp. HC18]
MSTNHKRRLLLLAGAAAGGLGLLAPFLGAQPEERVIKVIAKRFDYTPSEIHLKKGMPVTLELTSLDVVMGFNAPDFGVRSDVLPGAVSRVRFTPDKVGRFVFQCDIFCGAGHEEMAGVMIVA